MAKRINELTTQQTARVSNDAFLVADLMDSGGSPQETVKVEADDLPVAFGINDGVAVYSAGWRPSIHKPSADTDAARGAAFLAAHGAASSGDVVIAAPGEYDLAGAFAPKDGVEYRCHDCKIYHSVDDTGLIVPAVVDGAVYKVFGGHWDNQGSRVSDYCRGLDMRLGGSSAEDIPEMWFYPQSVSATAESSSAIYIRQGRLFAHLPYVKQPNYDCIEIGAHSSLAQSSNQIRITADTLEHGQASGSSQSNGVEVAGSFTATGSVSVRHIINNGPGPSVNVAGVSVGLSSCNVTVDKITINNTAGQAAQLNGNSEVRIGFVEINQFLAATGLDAGVALINFVNDDNRCFVDFLDGGSGWACNWGSTSDRCELHTKWRRGAFALNGTEITTDAAFRSLCDSGNIEVGSLPIHTTDPSVGNVPVWGRYFLGATLKYRNAETGTLVNWS